MNVFRNTLIFLWTRAEKAVRQKSELAVLIAGLIGQILRDGDGDPILRGHIFQHRKGVAHGGKQRIIPRQQSHSVCAQRYVQIFTAAHQNLQDLVLLFRKAVKRVQNQSDSGKTLRMFRQALT